MNWIILKLSAKYLTPVFILFSVYILFRGHNAPGGGFIGGLIAGSGILFYVFAYGIEKAYSYLYLKPKTILITGFIFMFFSVIWGLIFGHTILKGMDTELDFAELHIKLGTPLLFDTGVYFTVAGVILIIIFSITEEIEWK